MVGFTQDKRQQLFNVVSVGVAVVNIFRIINSVPLYWNVLPVYGTIHILVHCTLSAVLFGLQPAIMATFLGGIIAVVITLSVYAITGQHVPNHWKLWTNFTMVSFWGWLGMSIQIYLYFRWRQHKQTLAKEQKSTTATRDVDQAKPADTLTAKEKETVQRRIGQQMMSQEAREALSRLQRRLEWRQFARESYEEMTNKDSKMITQGVDWSENVDPDERHAEQATMDWIRTYFQDGKRSRSTQPIPHMISWLRCQTWHPEQRRQQGIRVRPLEVCFKELELDFPKKAKTKEGEEEKKTDGAAAEATNV